MWKLIDDIEMKQKLLPVRSIPVTVGRSRYGSLLNLLPGLFFALLAAYLIARGDWIFAAAALSLIPITAVLWSRPFHGVVLWLLVMPFYEVLPSPSIMYWGLYRILPLVLFGFTILARLMKPGAHPPARFGPPELAMCALLFFVPSTTLLFQDNPNTALIRFGDRMFIPFILYLVIRLTAPREKEFLQLQWIALFIAVTQSMVGFLSWAAPGMLPDVWLDLQGHRTTGTMVDPDLYASILVFSALIMVHAVSNQKAGLIRWMFIAGIGLCVIFAFLSLERAAWLGGIFVVIGLFALYPKNMLRIFIALPFVIALTDGILLTTHTDILENRLTASDPVLTRFVIFDAMAQMVRDKPVFGWGYETLDQHIQPYYRRVGEASITKRVITSHNTYFTIMTELGIVGFMLYLFPVFWWLVLSIRVWPRMKKSGIWSRRLLALFWLTMLFIFTTNNFVDMRWFPLGITLWWMILGMIANMVYPYLKGRDPSINSQLLQEQRNG